MAVAAQSSRLSRSFRKKAAVRSRVLVERYGEEIATQITEDACRRYDSFVPEIESLPKGLLNGALAGTYDYLVYAQAMRERGYSAEEIGSFFSDSYDTLIERFPKWLGPVIFRVARPFLRRKLKKDAAANTRDSRERSADGWQYEYVAPEHGSHDLGFNVTQCAVCTLFKRHEAEDLVPYLCALDDKMSQTLDMGLRREGTRAVGASCCDFRYKAGGEPKALSSKRSLPISQS